MAGVIALDASAIIAHLSARDEHHDEATLLLAEAAPGTLVAHSVTLAEVLVGGARSGRETEMLEDLTVLGIRPAPYRDGEFLELARLRARTGRKFPDCCVLLTAGVSAGAVATFDRALRTSARSLGLPVLPA